jgi:hypothetical protein
VFDICGWPRTAAACQWQHSTPGITTTLTVGRQPHIHQPSSPAHACREQLMIPDVMIVPNLERLAAGLAAFRGFPLDSHPSFPRVAAWFSAVRQRPSYQRTGSDSTTTQLVFGKRISLDVVHDITAMDGQVVAARRLVRGRVTGRGGWMRWLTWRGQQQLTLSLLGGERRAKGHLLGGHLLLSSPACTVPPGAPVG